MPFEPLAFAVSRRLVVGGLLASAVPFAARPQEVGSTTLLSIADLHSGYARMPQLLALMRREAAETREVVILLNGDLFELANVVSTRSRGAADLAFLSALSELGPVIVNIGNHEPDFVDDMAEVVPLLAGTGARVVSNIVDPRTGRLYAPLTQTTSIAGRAVTVAGIATDNLFTYPEAIRPQLAVPGPVPYARALLDRLSPDPMLVLSHAGIAADKEILGMLPEGSVAIGGHDHLALLHDGPSFYGHGGAWGRLLTRLDLTPAATGFDVQARHIEVPSDGETDSALAALIEELEETHLQPEDRATVGVSPREMSLRESILFAVEAVRTGAEADLAVLGHTTFGATLPAGSVRRYDFDAFIRFDGDIVIAEVDGATLRRILSVANQHDAATLEERTGDFVHAEEFEVDPDATYRLATNGWTATNQQRYLGTDGLAFSPVEGLTLKGAAAEALGG
jgi:2',3'-cyclic-nucleotide 2'-phosphodiesterase (5'-nucleotidase family)